MDNNSDTSSDNGMGVDDFNDAFSNSSSLRPPNPPNSIRSVSTEDQSDPGPPASTWTSTSSPETATSSNNSSDPGITPIRNLTNVPTLVNTFDSGVEAEGSQNENNFIQSTPLSSSSSRRPPEQQNVGSTQQSSFSGSFQPLNNNNSRLSPSEAAALEAQIRAADRRIGLPPLQQQQRVNMINEQNGGQQMSNFANNRNPPYPTANGPTFPTPQMVTGPPVSFGNIIENVQRPPANFSMTINDQTRLLIAQIADNYFEANKTAIYQHISNLLLAQMTQFVTNHWVTIVDTLNRQGEWPWRFCQCGNHNESGQQRSSSGGNFFPENLPGNSNRSSGTMVGQPLPYPPVPNPNPPLVGQQPRQDSFPVVGRVRNSSLTNNPMTIRQKYQEAPPLAPGIAVTPPSSQNQGPGQMSQGPSEMNQGPVQVNQVAGQMNQIPGQINQGSGQINREPGQINQGPEQMNQGPGQINQRPGQVNQGPSQVNEGPGQINQVADQINQGPGQVNSQSMMTNNSRNLSGPSRSNVSGPRYPCNCPNCPWRKKRQQQQQQQQQQSLTSDTSGSLDVTRMINELH